MVEGGSVQNQAGNALSSAYNATKYRPTQCNAETATKYTAPKSNTNNNAVALATCPKPNLYIQDEQKKKEGLLLLQSVDKEKKTNSKQIHQQVQLQPLECDDRDCLGRDYATLSPNATSSLADQIPTELDTEISRTTQSTITNSATATKYSAHKGKHPPARTL